MRHINQCLKALLLACLLMFLSSCATSPKVPVVQMGDYKFSCEQLKHELQKLHTAQDDVDSKKGATRTNVAAALFWLPGLAYTYYDAGKATRAIGDRRSHLITIAKANNCE